MDYAKCDYCGEKYKIGTCYPDEDGCIPCEECRTINEVENEMTCGAMDRF